MLPAAGGSRSPPRAPSQGPGRAPDPGAEAASRPTPLLWRWAVFQGDVQRTLIQVDFGDGIAVSYVNLSSMEDGIKHVYHNVGIFRVTVQVDNSLGSDSARPVLTCNLYVITVVGLWHISNIASFESITQCFRSRSSSPVTFKEMGREDKRAEWENVEGKSGSRAWIILEFVLLQLVLIGLTVPFLGASEPIPPVAGGWRLGRALGLHMFVTFFFFF